MADIDFATVGDDIMVTGAFLLRQTLSEWYRTQSWYPKDLEQHAKELAAVPRVLWMGPSSYTSFFIISTSKFSIFIISFITISFFIITILQSTAVR